MKRHLLLLVIPAFFIGCSRDADFTRNEKGPSETLFQWLGFETKFENLIQVVDQDQKPIAKAFVLIGNAQNDPFAGNYLQTDDAGQLALPEQWQTVASVTIDAPGYIRQTLLDQNPGTMKIVLRKKASTNLIELKGTSKGLPIADKDDIVDVGIVMPAMTKQDLLAFDIGKVISPVSDSITVLGQDINIPSNVSLPSQREHYYFNVTLEKPLYRVYFKEPGINRVYAARGRFAFESTVDRLRGGEPFYELINDFKISGGAVRDLNLVVGSNKLDIPMMEVTYKDKMSVQAPSMAKNQIMLTATAADLHGDLMLTDVKKLTSGQKIDLSVMTGMNSLQLAVLKNQAEFAATQGAGSDRLSAVLVPAVMGFAPQFLPLIPNPSFDKLGNVVYAKPNSIAGVNPIATYSILSEVQVSGSGDSEVKRINNVWEVYSNTWNDRVTLPKWPLSISAATKKRWEVTFVGSQNTMKADLGPQLLESATHVTHSSIEF